jgi:hypothetical protein
MGLQAKESLDTAQQKAVLWGREQGSIVEYLSEVDQGLLGAERAFPYFGFERVVAPSRVFKELVGYPELVNEI